jgi:hypothetical protein
VRITVTWLRLEVRRRWRSLIVLTLLVALATATVLAAAAGARRGQTAFGRLWDSTLPATVTVLPNQAGFDWDKVRALPEVAALSEFAVVFGFSVDCCPGASSGFPPTGDEMARTLERPALLAGRVFNPGRTDEVMVTPQFAHVYHKDIGDTITLLLATPKQMNEHFDGSTGPPLGPRIKASIVGIGRTVFGSTPADKPAGKGGVLASPALVAHYRANILGTNGQNYLNALLRLKGGIAAIPAFRADLARVTGRSDIDVLNNRTFFGGLVERLTRYEAACLFAFALAALVAALFLIGQSVARYTSATMADLRVLQAVGMTPRQAVASAIAPSLLATAAGSTLGVVAAIVASRWMPIGAALYSEPRPGISADWLILGPGWVLAPVLVAAGSAAAATLALAARRRGGRRVRRTGRGGRPVRARTRARPGRRAGPARPARRGGGRPGRARCLHLLGGGV